MGKMYLILDVLWLMSLLGIQIEGRYVTSRQIVDGKESSRVISGLGREIICVEGIIDPISSYLLSGYLHCFAYA